MPELAQRIIEAHGGEAHWREVTRVMATVSLGGLGVASRLQPSPLRHVEVTVRPDLPEVLLAEWPDPGCTASFQPNRVVITDAHGAVVAERTAPATTFRSLAHRMRWDHLDVLYYCGVTLWQALCLPLTLLRTGVQLEVLEPLDLGATRWHRLRVVLPADIPVFTREQILHADATGLVHRVDSTPRSLAGLFQLGQMLEDHEVVDGCTVAATRRAYPRLPSGELFMLCCLLWIDLTDIGVTRDRVG